MIILRTLLIACGFLVFVETVDDIGYGAFLLGGLLSAFLLATTINTEKGDDSEGGMYSSFGEFD